MLRSLTPVPGRGSKSALAGMPGRRDGVQVMKARLYLPALSVLTALLAGCVAFDGVVEPPLEDQQAEAAKETTAYQVGVSMGRQDAINGLPNDPIHHHDMVAEEDLVVFDRGYEAGYEEGAELPEGIAIQPYDPTLDGSGAFPTGFTQPLRAVVGPGLVTIREGDLVLCSITTASPEVVETAWRQEQEQIVVKSRAPGGAAMIQLFDSRTGEELGKVEAEAVKDGQPAWAVGLGGGGDEGEEADDADDADAGESDAAADTDAGGETDGN